MKIIMIGFGLVGQGLAQILRDKADELRSRQGFTARIVGVVTASKGNLYHADGLDIDGLLRAAESGSFASYPEDNQLRRDLEARQLIKRAEADVLVEVSPTDLQTAQPALDYCRLALKNGLHLVLANKGPVALGYRSLNAAAAESNLQMRYEATVMAGTPTLHVAEDALAGCAISAARGILNGTTNYILTQMEDGLPYADALNQAQALGYAETDPSGDVEGWDAAGKILILANAIFGSALTMNDLQVEGITKISQDDIAAAKANDQRYKLIAEVSADGGSVAPRRLPLNDPLASVGGATNAITFDTDLMGAITLIGAGAGQLETGYALLSDLLAIHRSSAL